MALIERLHHKNQTQGYVSRMRSSISEGRNDKKNVNTEVDNFLSNENT
jgi:hypothetical protein